MTNTMNIPIEKIQFGDPDALHEFMKQDKDGSRILQNSFIAPPRANLEQLENGSRFLIIGPKGSGKTTILLQLMRSSQKEHSRLILFKTNIRKEDRAQLDKLTQMIFVTDLGGTSFDTDYKTIWEWYILKNIFRLIDPSDILEGLSYFKDIALLLEADKAKFSSLFDSMKIEGGKGSIKLSAGVGSLKTEIAAELEAKRQVGDQIALLDLVRLTQLAMSKIRLKAGVKCRLYFDELEFFLEKNGDGERDRRMVRDLVFAIYNSNILFQSINFDALCYASIRSEVIHSFPGSAAELGKITKAFGIRIGWEPMEGQRSAIIAIFENKISQSEIYESGNTSPSPIARYFPEMVEGKPFERFLLDVGGHKPRGALLCLSCAAERAWGRDVFLESDFEDEDNAFGQCMLDEFKEELSASIFEESIQFAISLLRGKAAIFDFEEFRRRIAMLNNSKKEKNFLSAKEAESLLTLLYRAGLVGNWSVGEGGAAPKQTWSARGYPDPSIDRKFIVHASLRKILQLT